MKYDIKVSKSFKQDLKKAKKRGFDISKLERVINKLADGEMLEEKYSDHALRCFLLTRTCYHPISP